ncbi:MAG TPA: biotin/lipoate--protein ligase family protein [Beijerinckiaceae bacterium]|nr:biotin/lipoate--protein ligase family protein [Beijerinckiaceae bacterium]
MAALAAKTERAPLDLPPPYTLVTLREAGDAFAHACGVADEMGAGTLVWVRRFDLVEFAVVLEPEETLASARRAFFCCMAALADAIAVHCLPETEVVFEWPDAIRLNGARIGGARLGWPAPCADEETPGWLVFGAMLTAAWTGGIEPGLRPAVTSLEEEGFDSEQGQALIESFSRYLMRAFDTWSAKGFGPIADQYLARLEVRKAGERRGIDGNGDLLIRRHGREDVERQALVPALREAVWLDRCSGMPKA